MFPDILRRWAPFARPPHRRERHRHQNLCWPGPYENHRRRYFDIPLDPSGHRNRCRGSHYSDRLDWDHEWDLRVGLLDPHQNRHPRLRLPFAFGHGRWLLIRVRNTAIASRQSKRGEKKGRKRDKILKRIHVVIRPSIPSLERHRSHCTEFVQFLLPSSVHAGLDVEKQELASYESRK